MRKRISAAIAVILCMAIIVFIVTTVSATGTLEPGSSGESSLIGNSSVDSSNDSSLNSSIDSSIVGSTDSSTVGSTDSSSQTSTSSEESSSSETLNSSSDSSESDGDSSESTSSKKPVHTDGGNGGNFISQDVTIGGASSEFKISIPSSTTEATSEVEDEYDDGEDHYVAKAERYSGGLNIVKWVAIVIAVLCVGALITVNVMFRKTYPKHTAGATRKKHTGSHNAKRRGK